MDDLDKRLDLLRQTMAEPLADPPLLTPEQWLDYLRRKLAERRRNAEIRG
jgi:hypothetical protein